VLNVVVSVGGEDPKGPKNRNEQRLPTSSTKINHSLADALGEMGSPVVVDARERRGPLEVDFMNQEMIGRPNKAPLDL
jgi:hypothetical protein